MTGKMGEDLEFLICVCNQLPKGGGFAATLAAYVLFDPWSVAPGALSMNPLKGPYICLAASPSVGDANVSHLVLKLCTLLHRLNLLAKDQSFVAACARGLQCALGMFWSVERCCSTKLL